MAYHPKVVPYEVEAYGEYAAVRTASHYRGERHHSFPGSAGMTLAAYLERTSPTPSRSRRRSWTIRHPSGEFDVRLRFDAESRDSLSWTEFTTPVKVLAWGSADMPWRSRN